MENQITELIAALKRSLKAAMPEVPKIELLELNYQDVISGREPAKFAYHGIQIKDWDLFHALSKAVREVYDADRAYLYLTIEAGPVLQVVADVENDYGQSIGTEYFIVKLIPFLEKLQRRSQQFSSEALKEVAQKTIQTLENFLE